MKRHREPEKKSKSNAAPSKRRKVDEDDQEAFTNREHSQDECPEDYTMPEDTIEDDDVQKPVVSGGIKRNWHIPKPLTGPLNSTLVFQEIETDYAMSRAQSFQAFQYSGRQYGEVPVLRMYGMTHEGNSVCVHLWGFEPYFYVPMPVGWDLGTVDWFHEELEKLAQEKQHKTKGVNFVTRLEVVQKTTMFKYQTTRGTNFIKIVTGIPGYVPVLRRIIENGFFVPGRGPQPGIQTYESDVLFTMRCMIDANLTPMTWIEVSSFEQRTESRKVTRCDIEVDCSCTSAKSLTENSIAKFRILSFDIECLGYTEEGRMQHGKKKIMFPVATHKDCKIISICNTLTCFGDTSPLQRTAFVLHGCDEIHGATVHTFRTEEDLLLGWASYVRAADPDIVTGYNIINFDFPFMCDRVTYLSLNGNMDEFFNLGRDIYAKMTWKSKKFQSKQMGNRDTHDVKLKGRVVLDMLNVILREHKLGSYKLNNVSSQFLGEQKEDVHYSEIGTLFEKNDQTRKRLASYCLQDTHLPQRLIDKLMTIYNLCEMSRVCGLSMGLIMERGQQIKVVSQILREALKHNLVMPTPTQAAQDQASAAGDEIGYEGATVLDPIPGCYDKTSIATLDFASLYPSIMIAHNLCFSTLIDKEQMDPAHPEWYTFTPAGYYFIKKDVSVGLLPIILRNLLDARDRAKQLLKTATDPMEKAVYNGRQLALKISANSVYGFTGASRGKMVCVPISSSVTAFGREMIKKTKEYVETTYTKAKGFPKDAVVIYGDTDSVMVDFGYPDIATSMAEGKKAAKEVSKIFISPIRLEFEKVYFPYILLAKKHYAGLLWTNPVKWDKLDAKGIESVRRDKCGLVRLMVKHGLELFLEKRNKPALIRFLARKVHLLVSNKIDISLLCQSKTISRPMEKYLTPQPHTELAKRMAKRDAASAPKLGDRVNFVYIPACGTGSGKLKGTGKGKLTAKDYERSEDPTFVLENGLALDNKYYLDNKVRPVIERTFQYVLTPEEMKYVFEGKHAQKSVVVIGGNEGVAKFFKQRNYCFSCKATIDKGAICKNCVDKAQSVYMKLVKERNRYEKDYTRAYSYCHTCQNALCREVLCANEDCPLFFMKKQAKVELIKLEEKLQKFDEVEW